MDLWNYSAGQYGNKVTVWERTQGGMIHARWSENGNRKVRSLGHRSKSKAMEWAHRKSERLHVSPGAASLEQIFKAYLEYKSPEKSIREQKADKRRVTLFKEIPDLEGWRKWIKDRGDVGNRTIEADLKWFKGVLNWAVNWGLLDKSPIRGFPVPTEKNPHQPVMSEEAYRKILEKADEVHPYLKALLIVAHGTGRRLSAICKLRWEDIGESEITWRRDTDKQGIERRVPITSDVRQALDAPRREGWVFPAPRRDGQPLHRSVADKWGRQAAELAGVEWTGWHSLRRKWASERPLTQAVAFAGGWKDVLTMAKCYKKPSMDELKEAVENRREWNGG